METRLLVDLGFALGDLFFADAEVDFAADFAIHLLYAVHGPGASRLCYTMAMTLPLSSQHDFIRHYFPGSESRRAVKKQASAVTTLIIDHQALTDGSLHFEKVQSWPKQTVLDTQTVERALLHTPIALPKSQKQEQAPTAHSKGVVAGNIWHAGENYQAYWCGPPSAIAHSADLTDSEREEFLLFCRAQAARGHTLYAVSVSDHTTLPRHYGEKKARICAIVTVRLGIYPSIKETLPSIKNAGLSLIFVSNETEHTMMSLLAASGVGQAIEIGVERHHHIAIEGKMAYARVSPVSRRRILEHYGASALVVTDPLPAFWEKFSRLR